MNINPPQFEDVMNWLNGFDALMQTILNTSLRLATEALILFSWRGQKMVQYTSGPIRRLVLESTC